MMSAPPPLPPSPAENPIAEFQDVSKWYGDVIGLNQVSLKIHDGITGLLGPNGAGKSTFLKLLTGQLMANRGQVKVFGRDPWSDQSVYKSLGYCPDSEQLYDYMSGRDFVELIGRLAGFSARDARQRAALQLERVSMAQHCDRLIQGYSKGMRQRTRLAAALIHDPKLVVLDEPLNGLDPMGRLELISIFRNLAASGTAVLISSHILHELQTLTRRMVMLHRGRLLAEGEIGSIRALIESQPLTIRVTSDNPREIATHIMRLPSVSSLQVLRTEPTGHEYGLEVRSNTPDLLFQQLQNQVLENLYTVKSIEAMDDNLDAIFRYLVDKK